MESIVHYLTESARRHPDRVAARFKGTSLTYAQLDAWTNQLARALHRAGVQHGDRVGIYLNKSLGSLAAVFGIMKAGAAYVPFDPSAPVDRLAYIAKDGKLAAVVTRSDKLGAVEAMNAQGAGIATTVLVEGDSAPKEGLEIVGHSAIQVLDPTPLEGSPGPDDVAYILYTSGSTGRPKGVVIQHRNLFHFMEWAEMSLGLTQDDVVTSHAPLHFDLSTFDIYATIKAGGTIVLLPEVLSIFPIQLAKVLEEEKVTTIYMVPSILTMLLNAGKLGDFQLQGLKRVLFAGEVFPIKYLKQLAATLPQAELYNLYGPTETNVCTWYKVQPEDLSEANEAPVSIGIACGPTTLRVVDGEGKPIETPGVEGELLVQGSCVALGYHGDPEKTAKGFVLPEGEERIYRTGDRVEFAPDGKNLLYRGRRDHMIKSRGYRIELNEIESVLLAHPDVQEGAVIAVPDEMIGNRIHAFVSFVDGTSADPGQLRDHCAKKLPSYMIPESFRIFPRLPLTSSGKVNRVALSQLPE